MGPLHDRTVLVVGRGTGLARAIVIAARDAGAHVVAAGLDEGRLSGRLRGESNVTAEFIDLTDDASIEALGKRLGLLDHVVSTASARARGRLEDLDRDAVRLSFDTKVIGPLMLAKHLAPRTNEGGSCHLLRGRRVQDRGGHHGRGHHERGCRHPRPLSCSGVGSHSGERDLPGRDRYRCLGCSRRTGQGRLFRRYQSANPVGGSAKKPTSQPPSSLP